MAGPSHNPSAEAAAWRRRWEREHNARRAAETIAETSIRELYERQQRLELLEAVAAVCNRVSSLDDALAFTLSQVAKMVEWPLGHAWRLDPKAEAPSLVSTGIWHGAGEAELASFRHATESEAMDARLGLPGRVLESGAPVWVDNVAKDDNCPRAQAAAEVGLGAAFAIPISIGTEVVGVLEFFDRRPRVLHTGFLDAMVQVGSHLGRVVERQRAQERLLHDSSHDQLTGLPNRALFLDRLTRAVARQRRHPEAGFAVLFIDLDRFKVINESLGHQAGDKLILQVASRLEGSLRQSDTVARAHSGQHSSHRGGRGHRGAGWGMETLARLGGDEFTVLLDDMDDVREAVRVAERIQEELAQPFFIDGQEVYATASIGIASSASGYAAAEDVLRDADLAMYRAKSQGKARYEIFDQRMRAGAMRRLDLESNLRRALENQEFVLFYQPIVRLDTAEIKGFEALVRWRRPDGEMVYPADFVEVAEDTGLIVPLGSWALEEACRTMQSWRVQFPQAKPLSISVNLSARQFAEAELAHHVDSVLRRTGLAPQALDLEITESVMMGDSERSIKLLAQLKKLGLRFSIDDFGTGYSSLSYLHRFPLDTLKIDRSFVAQLGEGRDGVAIVRSILDLARNLGMQIIAEGAETEKQVAQLRRLGCEFAQGYYFSEPLEGIRATELLRSSSPALAPGLGSTPSEFVV